MTSIKISKPALGKEPLYKNLLKELKRLKISPHENLGQHSLIDKSVIDFLAQSVSPGNTVIEVGAGVGQLTEALAEKAGKVISIEIDRRYEPVLTQIAKQHPNIQIIFGDAIALNLQDLMPKQRDGERIQIVSNLPFHIAEPFLHKIAGLPIESATLVVGEKLARAIQALNEESIDFGQLTLLAETFFDIDVISEVEKQKSFPVPRTDSAIIRLIPKEEYEFRSSRRDFLLRRLFLTAKRSPLAKNCLKEGLIEFERVRQMGTLSKKEHNQLTQNQTRAIIEKMGIPDDILDKPFEQLNNNELRLLSKALRLV